MSHRTRSSSGSSGGGGGGVINTSRALTVCQLLAYLILTATQFTPFLTLAFL